MARDEATTRKLDEIRAQLLRDPPLEEIEKMQLQANSLTNLDALLADDTDPGHHHDHMDDHDHGIAFFPEVTEREA